MTRGLWRLFARGYLKSYPWVIVMLVVPSTMSLVLYLSLLSKNPGVVDRAGVFDFAERLPGALLGFSTAAHARWLAVYPSSPYARAVAGGVMSRLGMDGEPHYVEDGEFDAVQG